MQFFNPDDFNVSKCPEAALICENTGRQQKMTVKKTLFWISSPLILLFFCCVSETSLDLCIFTAFSCMRANEKQQPGFKPCNSVVAVSMSQCDALSVRSDDRLTGLKPLICCCSQQLSCRKTTSWNRERTLLKWWVRKVMFESEVTWKFHADGLLTSTREV